MDPQILEWLQSGPAWINYAVRRQLLDEQPDSKPAITDETIVRLVNRVKDPARGIAATRRGGASCETAGSAVWDLFLLADIGLSAVELNLEKEAEAVLSGQRPDGIIITEPSMEPNYFCMSAILIATLASMGYLDDSRVKKYAATVMADRHSEDGWVCEPYYSDCCPMDNLNILMLLGQYPEYRNDQVLNGALNLLMDHWQRRREKRRLQGFGIGRRYLSLEYPATKYGILRVLDVLSLFPWATRQANFAAMLDFVRDKERDGRYYAEPTTGAYREFDFGQTGEPSRWLTFLVNRITKRAGVSD